MADLVTNDDDTSPTDQQILARTALNRLQGKDVEEDDDDEEAAKAAKGTLVVPAAVPLAQQPALPTPQAAPISGHGGIVPAAAPEVVTPPVGDQVPALLAREQEVPGITDLTYSGPTTLPRPVTPPGALQRGISAVGKVLTAPTTARVMAQTIAGNEDTLSSFMADQKLDRNQALAILSDPNNGNNFAKIHDFSLTHSGIAPEPPAAAQPAPTTVVSQGQVAPAQTGMTPPQATAPQPVVPAGPDALTQAFNLQKKGILGEAAAKGAVATESAEAEKSAMANQESVYSDMQANSDAMHQQALDSISRMQAAITNYSNAKVDPDEWWNSRDTGQKVMAGLALALGAIGAGATGKNLGAEAINQSINDDIQRQKDAIERKEKVPGMLKNLYDVARQAGADSQTAMSAAILHYKEKAEQMVTMIGNQHGADMSTAAGQSALGVLQAGMVNTRSELAARALQNAKARQEMAIAAQTQMWQQHEHVREIQGENYWKEVLGFVPPPGSSPVKGPEGNWHTAASKEDAAAYQKEVAAPQAILDTGQTLLNHTKGLGTITHGEIPLIGDKTALADYGNYLRALESSGETGGLTGQALTERRDQSMKEFAGNPLAVLSRESPRIQAFMARASQQKAEVEKMHLIDPQFGSLTPATGTNWRGGKK